MHLFSSYFHFRALLYKSGKLNMKSRTIGLSWFVPSRRAQAAFTYFDFKVYQNLTGEIGKSECCVLFLLL